MKKIEPIDKNPNFEFRKLSHTRDFTFFGLFHKNSYNPLRILTEDNDKNSEVPADSVAFFENCALVTEYQGTNNDSGDVLNKYTIYNNAGRQILDVEDLEQLELDHRLITQHTISVCEEGIEVKGLRLKGFDENVEDISCKINYDGDMVKDASEETGQLPEEN